MPARSTALMCTNTSLLPSLGSMNPKPFWVLKNFTVPVAIMASLHCIAFYPITRASRGRSPNFGGSWLGTVKRKRREADRKLVAGCYLCDRGRNVKPDAGINPAQAVALGNRRSRRGVEWHRYRRFAVEDVGALGAWMPVVDAPDAE